MRLTTSRPRPAGPVSAPGGGAHRWTLRIELKRDDLDRQGGIRGKTDPEFLSTAPATGKSGTQTTVHEIHIAINKWLASYPEELAAHPDLQDRMNYMAGMTLLHELNSRPLGDGQSVNRDWRPHRVNGW